MNHAKTTTLAVAVSGILLGGARLEVAMTVTSNDIAPEPTHVAVYRKDYQVWRVTMPEPIFQVLSALHDGSPLGDAITMGGADVGAHDVQVWFREWSTDGLLGQLVGSDAP